MSNDRSKVGWIPRPPAPVADPADCPVVALMNKITGLFEAHRELDIEYDDDNVSQAMAAAWGARDVFMETATLTRAKSLQGALFQVALLRDALEEMMDEIRDPNLQAALRPSELKIGRLAYSIGAVLWHMIGDEAGKQATAHLLPDSEDPLVLIDLAAANQPVGHLFPNAKKRATPEENT